MNKLIEWMENKLMPIAAKISHERHFKAIRDTFITMLPLVFFGGIVSVISSAPVTETTTNGFLLAWAAFAEANGEILSWLSTVTMGFLSLWVTIGITYFLCRSLEEDPLAPICTAVACLVMMSGGIVNLGFGDVTVQLTYFDGKGIIVAMFVSIAVAELYHLMFKHNFGRIKVSDAMPDALSKSFASLIPGLVILLIFAVITIICHSAGTYFAEWFINAISPAIEASDTLLYALLIAFLLNFGWFFGIHDTVWSLLTSTVEYANLSINAAAVAAGIALPCVFTVSFWCYFGIIGGLGNCLALGILCLLSKNSEIRTIGRLGIVPAFFGISEPITFGLPIMLNPFMLVPCVLTSMVNVAITYILMYTNFIGRTFAMLSYSMPSIFGSFFSTNDWKAPILIVVLVLLDMLIYLPFFRAYEHGLEKGEL